MLKILKGDFDQPTWTKKSLLDHLAQPITQEEWLKGYWRWRKQQEKNNC